MKRQVGRVTVSFTESGWCPRTIQDIIDHTNEAFGNCDGPLRYAKFEIESASYNSGD